MPSLAEPKTYSSRALERLIRSPVSQQMIDHIATFASTVIECSPPPQQQQQHPHPRSLQTSSSMAHGFDSLPSPPHTPYASSPNKLHTSSTSSSSESCTGESSLIVPPMNEFIRTLVINSNVQASTLLPTLVYLERLKHKLPVAAK
ncbi:hypothetical protein BGZ93_005777, partial [Podila epicladia]